MPTINDDCGAECFFPQRLAEHPFMHDRFGYLKNYQVGGKPRPKLSERSAALFKHNDWWWAITGVHQGGGLDAVLAVPSPDPNPNPNPIPNPKPNPKPNPFRPCSRSSSASAARRSCRRPPLDQPPPHRRPLHCRLTPAAYVVAPWPLAARSTSTMLSTQSIVAFPSGPGGHTDPRYPCQQRNRCDLEKNATWMPAISWRLTPHSPPDEPVSPPVASPV